MAIVIEGRCVAYACVYATSQAVFAQFYIFAQSFPPLSLAFLVAPIPKPPPTTASRLPAGLTLDLWLLTLIDSDLISHAVSICFYRVINSLFRRLLCFPWAHM